MSGPRPRTLVARALAGAVLGAGCRTALRWPPVQRADVRVGDLVRRAGSPPLDRAVTLTTDLGSIYAVVGASAVLAGTGRTRLALEVLGIGCAAWALAQGSKTRVRRQRPYDAHGTRRLIRPPTGSSFPSGHAAVGVAVASVLADHTAARAGRAVWASMAAYVPVSRVYTGVHYPTDVVGGAGLGLALGAAWRGTASAMRQAPAVGHRLLP